MTVQLTNQSIQVFLGRYEYGQSIEEIAGYLERTIEDVTKILDGKAGDVSKFLSERCAGARKKVEAQDLKRAEKAAQAKAEAELFTQGEST